MHSFFFVEWVKNWEPGVTPPNDCEARFYFIGGNQDGDKITIKGKDKEKSIYNGNADYDCDVPDESNKTEMVWGNQYNFFGIVKSP